MFDTRTSVGKKLTKDATFPRLLTRIQVKRYYKLYLTRRKGNYACTTYYLYIPKHLAEPLVDKDLRVSASQKGLTIEIVG